MTNLMPMSDILHGAPPTPIASGQKRSVPAKRAMPLDKQMSQMKTIIKRMQQQTKRLLAATNPKERHKLMQVHVQTLKESVEKMRCMGMTR